MKHEASQTWQVTISVRASLQMLANWGEKGWIGQLGGWVALVTVLLQLLFVAKHGLAVRTLLQKQVR